VPTSIALSSSLAFDFLFTLDLPLTKSPHSNWPNGIDFSFSSEWLEGSFAIHSLGHCIFYLLWLFLSSNWPLMNEKFSNPTHSNYFMCFTVLSCQIISPVLIGNCRDDLADKIMVRSQNSSEVLSTFVGSALALGMKNTLKLYG
jgi:hypothetical protein